ncbi:receptor-transporting protein 3 [Otolemur garnettii]|uniref:receptor-transporting protein 3 n=1 Tax=Otolemur garnettii TaxID=30611 RepID=UPI00064477A5|nr:receptor-transporting protein 3 [Otolemur garnettii]
MAQHAEVWKQVFQELIQEVKPWHKWTLTPDKDLLPNALKPGWMQYQHRGFARFQCSSCSRGWASAHVQVLFHVHWSKENSRGRVKMRVFAQRCKRCSQPPFEVPEFTQENISRILNNLVIRILKKCYREGFKSMEEIPTIKDISLEGPHDTNNCEACLQGFCAQSGLGPAVQSPTPTSLPILSEDVKPKKGRVRSSESSLVAMPTQALSLPSSQIPRADPVRRVHREVKISTPLLSESSLVATPTQALSLPSSQIPRADPVRRVQREVKISPPLPSESSLVAMPTQARSLPTSQIPRADPVHQVQREVKISPPSSRHFSSYPSQSHTVASTRNIHWSPPACSKEKICSCCSFLLLIVLVVVIIIKTL